MRLSRRLLLVVLGCGFAAACSGGTKRGPVEDNSQRLISIELDRSTLGVGIPIALHVAVYSAAGERIRGEHVTIESSSPGDVLSPGEGTTDPQGELVAEFVGATIGTRRITARSGPWWGAVTVELGAPSCGGELLLGGWPEMEVVWPVPLSFQPPITGDFDGNGACDFVWFEDRAMAGNAPPLLTMHGASLNRTTNAPLPLGTFPIAATVLRTSKASATELAVVAWGEGRARILLLSHAGGGIWDAEGGVEMSANSVYASIGAADLDGDKRDDILLEVSTDGDSARSLRAFFRGDEGDLVEAGEIPLPVGQEESSWLAGDFTGDGKADVIVWTSRSSSLWIGDGRGSFERSWFPTASAPPAAAADLNGDGRIDVVGIGWNGLAIGIQTEDGGFSFATRELAGLTGWLRISDWDRDGIPDLLVTSRDPSGFHLFALPGRGDGTFGDAGVSAEFSEPSFDSFEVCDYWGTGELGVLFTESWGMTVLSVEKLPLGPRGEPYIFGWGWSMGAIGDLDGDGLLEVVSLASDGTAARISRPDGQSVREISFVEPLAAARVAIGPVEWDPRGSLLVEQAAPDRRERELRIVSLSDGGSELLLSVPLLRATAVGDLDGDGRADIAASASDETYVLFSSKNGFRFEIAATRGADAIATGDFDGDGVADLALLDDDGLEVLRGTRTSGFARNSRIPLDGQHVTTSDLDGDGIVDIVVWGARGIYVVHGGDFELWIPFDGSTGIVALVPGDFDGNGIQDLAVVGSDDLIHLHFGDGAGGFQPATTYVASVMPEAALFGNLAPATPGLLLLGRGGSVQSLPLACAEMGEGIPIESR